MLTSVQKLEHIRFRIHQRRQVEKLIKHGVTSSQIPINNGRIKQLICRQDY